MTGAEFGRDGDTVDLLLPPEALNEHLALLHRFEEQTGIAPGVIDALKPDALRLHTLNAPVLDRTLLEGALAENASSLNGTIQNVELLEGESLFSTTTRAQRRGKRPFTFDNPTVVAIYNEYHAKQKKGYMYSTRVSRVLTADGITYYDQIPPDARQFNINERASNEELVNFQELLGDDGAASGPLTNREILERMYTKQTPDHSKDTLDARFATVVGISQLQLTHSLSVDLLQLARIGGKAKPAYARSFLETHKGTMFGGDVFATLELYKQFAREARGFAEQEQNRTAQLFLKRMSGAATSFATTLDKALQTYGHIYRNLGYEVPAALRTEEDEQAIVEVFETQPESEQGPGPVSVPEAVGTIALAEVEIESPFEQLDKFILPPHASMEDIERELERIGIQESSVSEVQWQRLRDLVAVSNHFEDARLFKSKKKSLGGAPPYFVAVIMHEGRKYAVAETPVFKNATYVVSEAHVPGTWEEVLELKKSEALSVGAAWIRHSSKAPYGPVHVQKILDVITEFHATEAL